MYVLSENNIMTRDNFHDGEDLRRIDPIQIELLVWSDQSEQL